MVPWELSDEFVTENLEGENVEDTIMRLMATQLSNDLEELYIQGMEFFAQDKLDDAIAAYQRALEEDASYADALHALAMSYAQLGRLEEAIAAGKRLIEVAPDDELAYTSLSIFYQQKGMIAEAEQVGAQARTLGWKRQLEEANQRKKS